MICLNPECGDFRAFGVHGEYCEGVVVCPRCGAVLSARPSEAPGGSLAEGTPHVGASRRSFGRRAVAYLIAVPLSLLVPFMAFVIVAASTSNRYTGMTYGFPIGIVALWVSTGLYAWAPWRRSNLVRVVVVVGVSASGTLLAHRAGLGLGVDDYGVFDLLVFYSLAAVIMTELLARVRIRGRRGSQNAA